jgi:hypothetical protein
VNGNNTLFITHGIYTRSAQRKTSRVGTRRDNNAIVRTHAKRIYNARKIISFRSTGRCPSRPRKIKETLTIPAFGSRPFGRLATLDRLRTSALLRLVLSGPLDRLRCAKSPAWIVLSNPRARLRYAKVVSATRFRSLTRLPLRLAN